MTPRERAESLLKSVGAVLVRKRKHEIWRLPDGRNWVRSSTPSDVRSDLNNLSDLRRQIGKPVVFDRSAEPTHKPHKPHKKPHMGDGKHRPSAPVHQPLADALRLTGLVEDGLRAQIAKLQTQVVNLTNTVGQLRTANAAYRAQVHHCWMCRLRAWTGKRFPRA